MNRDLHSQIKITDALTVTTISAAGDTDGTIIDTAAYGLGFESIVFALKATVFTAGSFAISKFEEGNESTLSDASDIALTSDRVIGTASSPTELNDITKLGVVTSGKRYVRAVFTADATADMTVTCDAILGNAHYSPVD